MLDHTHLHHSAQIKYALSGTFDCDALLSYDCRDQLSRRHVKARVVYFYVAGRGDHHNSLLALSAVVKNRRVESASHETGFKAWAVLDWDATGRNMNHRADGSGRYVYSLATVRDVKVDSADGCSHKEGDFVTLSKDSSIVCPDLVQT